MVGIAPSVLEAFNAVSQSQNDLSKVIYDPPYMHQYEAVRGVLIDRRNLLIMTSTGSGKTESFLLPILGKLAQEACERPGTFSDQPAIRALILYPMNALVNDQLGKLRELIGDPRLVSLFKDWAGRPPRFGRYISRTPYSGVRTPQKDSSKLRVFDDFYVNIERSAHDQGSENHFDASRIMRALKKRGRWPAKPDLGSWLGRKGTRWKNSKNTEFVRAITLQDDSELITRHEFHCAPPDVLVTNYSMLEYMMMRPIERSIFDKTRSFFENNSKEDFLVVLDEAHLYRGALGAEVGLLLRRLRDRINVSKDRFRVICATASFGDATSAPEFGAQISGLPSSSFLPIKGALQLHSQDGTGSEQDCDFFANLNLEPNQRESTNLGEDSTTNVIANFLRNPQDASCLQALYSLLADFPPMGRLINETMKQAIPVADLGRVLFPMSDIQKANDAVSNLMNLGSVARENPNMSALLPCRIHNFFRGLPGLWICMDPNCSVLHVNDRNGICGKLFHQPRETCQCGARVLELYTCRYCGTAYARAYTDDVDCPLSLWSEPGEYLRLAEGETGSLYPLDLLLETPVLDDLAERVDYDLETGRLNPNSAEGRIRRVYIRGDRLTEASSDEHRDSELSFSSPGQFIPCAVCGHKTRRGTSYVQDHQTKGDEPFQALVSRQVQIQPASSATTTTFAPLQGRKVLAFSDSRQVAARLAPNLQLYSLRDSLRPLIAWGYQRLQAIPSIKPTLNLDDLYLAVLIAAHTLNVRLRPELKDLESFRANLIVRDALENPTSYDSTVMELVGKIRPERPPVMLLEQIVTTIQDRFRGFEQLAVASLAECAHITQYFQELVPIPNVADTSTAKKELVRAWIRCWQNNGFWLSAMPTDWAQRSRSQGISVRAAKGKFIAMSTVLTDREAKEIFDKRWLPKLLELFTETTQNGLHRLRGSELTLDFDGHWLRCHTCKSVQRPVSTLRHCIDCGSDAIEDLNPDHNPVFQARTGFYRDSIKEVLDNPKKAPCSIIAAEHTAQLNAPQNDDVFSKAEENEMLFQDVDITLNQQAIAPSAIDVLSSTTTMEVGIDIGTLTGVALRNMPPSRANYQQRSGRAGRRGNNVATVVAFGSADSHDEHYFSNPDYMIRGEVVDPKLTLDNTDIVRRHMLAFLLQAYHQERIPTLDVDAKSDLFSVLGTVAEFRDIRSVINRDDFAKWLSDHEADLRERLSAWIPQELSPQARSFLLNEFVEDCLLAIDRAIDFDVSTINSNSPLDVSDDEIEPEEHQENLLPTATSDKLLHRLLYRGVLPRYAFPTDVATFHVFDRKRSSGFKPIMQFAPQRSLPIALSQYAPGKHVWISGKCYTSSAIYSIIPGERHRAWDKKRMYLECDKCGFANTYAVDAVVRNETMDCPACGSNHSFGPARYWMRPPGFAHAIDSDELTSPDEIPETSYATRAKLTMDTPDQSESWTVFNERLRALPTRRHLLVSNTGPKKDGYTYCTTCGRIDATADHSKNLAERHFKPYPEVEDKQTCDGSRTTRHLVLGTDFITDIALFSLRVDSSISLTPGFSSTLVALRTVSEALAFAACKLLELEPGELMAEFRPALTPEGTKGKEAEIFLYDTLPGGAGFSVQLAQTPGELFQVALDLLLNCGEHCETSCYRCLRSFKNKLEHNLLDRHVGAQLISYVLDSQIVEFSTTRIDLSTALLCNDLNRQCTDGTQFQLNAPILSGTVPILATSTSGMRRIIALSAPLTPQKPADSSLNVCNPPEGLEVIVENELVVRWNLPSATRRVLRKLS